MRNWCRASKCIIDHAIRAHINRQQHSFPVIAPKTLSNVVCIVWVQEQAKTSYSYFLATLKQLFSFLDLYKATLENSITVIIQNQILAIRHQDFMKLISVKFTKISLNSLFVKNRNNSCNRVFIRCYITNLWNGAVKECTNLQLWQPPTTIPSWYFYYYHILNNCLCFCYFKKIMTGVKKRNAPWEVRTLDLQIAQNAS